MENLDFYELLEQDQHDPEVQYRLGICYLYGNGIEKDPQEAQIWLQRAAEQGHEQAIMLTSSPDTDATMEQLNEETLPEWCMRAEDGDAEAQFAVAQYFAQQGYEENRSDIQRYLQEAAEQGHGEACLILGRQYVKEGDYRSAILHLERACECSFVEAAELLSYCYFHGAGVHQDTAKAERYLMRASEWGNAEVMLRIAFRYAIGQDIPASQTKAMAFLGRAQQAGMENARERFSALVADYRQAEEMERNRKLEEEHNRKLEEERCWQERQEEEERRRKLEEEQCWQEQQEAERRRTLEEERFRQEQLQEVERQRRLKEEQHRQAWQLGQDSRQRQARETLQQQEREWTKDQITEEGKRVLALAKLRNGVLYLPMPLLALACAVFGFVVALNCVTYPVPALLIGGCYAAAVIIVLTLARRKYHRLDIKELEQLVKKAR